MHGTRVEHERKRNGDARSPAVTSAPAQAPRPAGGQNAAVGNAAIARLASGGGVLQRMQFARFQGLGRLTNWWYDDKETALLKGEADLAAYIANLEGWATADATMQSHLANFALLQGGTFPTSRYGAITAGMKQLQSEMRQRRAELLNENPSRVNDDPTFANHLPDALVGEIQQFLGRGLIDKSAFRLVVPVPGEHTLLADAQLPDEALKPGLAPSMSDEDLEAGLAASIAERMTTLQEKLSSEGDMLWTYSTDGLLSIGSSAESKHPVVGAGADVWAAGTVRLKITEGETTFGRYRSHIEKIERFRDMEKAAAADPSLTDDKRQRDLRDLRENRVLYEGEAVRDKAAYEKLGFDPDHAAGIGKTVVIDFDSGHYAPTEAWRRAASAWQKLGYKVEFNAEGRTA